MNTCRYCKQVETSPRDGFHYSTRHFAHFRCWLERNGADAWYSLNSFKRGRFPIVLLDEFNIDYKHKRLQND